VVCDFYLVCGGLGSRHIRTTKRHTSRRLGSCYLCKCSSDSCLLSDFHARISHPEQLAADGSSRRNPAPRWWYRCSFTLNTPYGLRNDSDTSRPYQTDWAPLSSFLCLFSRHVGRGDCRICGQMARFTRSSERTASVSRSWNHPFGCRRDFCEPSHAHGHRTFDV
jgi:hypothetical protein